MFLKELLYDVLFLKPTRFKNLRIYRPTKTIISKDASFNIEKNLNVNKLWNEHRGLPSVFKVESGAIINCKSFTFHQCFVILYENAVLNLGHNSFINNGGRLICKQSITIGNHTYIGLNVEIRDTDSHTIVGRESIAPVIIGDNVWIGSGAIILKGVTIGNGSVIGAGSVVTDDIPPRCLAVGTPAKVIRENIEWHG